MRKVVIENTVTRTVGLSPGPQGPEGPAGTTGPTGPAGEGVAPGGTTGQILSKFSNTDYATEWVDAPSVAPEVFDVTDATTYAVTAGNNGGLLWINQSGPLEILLPDSLGEDFQVTGTGYCDDDVTFTAQGTSTLSPSGYTIPANSGVPLAFTCVFKDGVWTVVGPQTPNTITVVYDSGWPASRPNAVHVQAWGHTTSPSWLTGADAWFEAV
jgi:hypothetical protein